jgi:putative GTP pyrophosphokinase
LPFEIQIRSILQHAWAEIEHDRNYKFTGKLPTQLERRFYLIAGMLESADREFVSIAKEIDKYKNTVAEELTKGDLDIEINTASLNEYLTKRFRKLIELKALNSSFGSSEGSAKIIEELNLFGIRKISQLDKIIPNNFKDNILSIKNYNTNFTALLRHILIINDIDKYFKVCWRKAWQIISYDSLKVINIYGIGIADLQKYTKEIHVG